MEGDNLNSKSVDREMRALIERSELVEKPKSRVVSVVEKLSCQRCGVA